MASSELAVHDELGDTMREIVDLMSLAMDMDGPVPRFPREWYVVSIEGRDVYFRPSARVLAMRDRLRELAGTE